MQSCRRTSWTVKLSRFAESCELSGGSKANRTIRQWFRSDSLFSAKSPILANAAHAVFSDAIAQRLLRKTQQSGRLALVALGLPESVHHHAPLDVPYRVGQAPTPARAHQTTILEIAGQRVGPEDTARIHGQDPLDVVLKLAHVALPVALHENRHEVSR